MHLACVIASFMLASPLAAQTITVGLDGTTHPVDAGWGYTAIGNGLSATAVFSVVDGTIQQNTLGAGYAGQGTNHCYTNIVVPHPSAWVVRARVRVMATETWTLPFGAYVAFGNTGFGLMTNSVSPLNAGWWTSLAHDGTAWHDYRLEAAACGRWTLSIDGTEVFSSTGAATQGTLQFAFGDGTGGANAQAQYDFVEITVNISGVAADFNGDGAVGGADLGLLLANWGQPGITDLDCSGATDGADLGMLLSSWG